MAERTAERFEPDETSSRSARWFVAGVLRGWGLHHLVADATLLVSELATNAAIHGGTAFEVDVAQADDGTVRITVTDRGGGRPEVLDIEPDALRGRGLLLVDHLSSEWGWEALDGGGKAVWFALHP